MLPSPPLRPVNSVFVDLPVWHDHTPAFTSALGAQRASRVTLRLKTTLDVEKVMLKVLEYGEIMRRETREIAPLDGEGRWFEVDLTLHARKVHYAWQLLGAGDNLHFTMAGLHRARRPYRDWFHYVADYRAPSWAWRTVFYQIFPDRFRNGDEASDVQTGEYEYAGRSVEKIAWDTPPARDLDIHAHYGGDLYGVRDAMPYLSDLGVGALWITPIFLSPSAHRYDVMDYRRVDPHVGGEEGFEAMMLAAERAHIRVVLDGVFNHIGSEHPLFVKAMNDERAREREMFTFREAKDGKPPYAAFYDVPTMPKIDYNSELAISEFLDGEMSVVRFWLRRGVSGWRLDVAQSIGVGGTDEGNLEMHRRIKEAARQERADAYVFGERFFDAEAALTGEGEDGVMNYHGFGLPLMEWFTQEHYLGFASRLDTGEMLDLMWDAYHVLTPQIALNQFNLLDSHDVPRALSRLDGDKTKLRAALTLLMGFPGVPCIYYGTEIGLAQPEKGSMPFNREPMPWDESKWDHDLRADVQRLIQIRRETRVLQEGAMRLLLAEPDAVGFVRSFTHADGKRELAVVLGSRRGEAHEVTVDLPTGTWRLPLTDEIVSRGGPTTLDISAGAVLISEED